MKLSAYRCDECDAVFEGRARNAGVVAHCGKPATLTAEDPCGWGSPSSREHSKEKWRTEIRDELRPWVESSYRVHRCVKQVQHDGEHECACGETVAA